MIEIETLAKWSDPKQVDTKNGKRNLRKAIPNSKFWDVWKASKEELKKAGVSCSKNGLDWELCWWLPLDSDQQKEAEKKIEESQAKDSDFFVPCPSGLAFLPFQKAGIKYAMSRENVLIADSMGLGKSIQAVGVWNLLPEARKCLVVCPSSLRLNWKREFSKWSVRPVNVEVILNGKEFPSNDFDVLVCNYDVVGKHRANIDSFQWDLLVIDEAHFLKNPNTARTKAVLGDGIEIERIKATKTLFLSGTPIVNRPKELFTLLQVLDPKGLGRNFFNYAKDFCNAYKKKVGRYKEVWDFSGASNLDRLQREMREKFMVRRLKEEVLLELPPKRRQVIEIPANGSSGLVRQEWENQDKLDALNAELELAKAISKEEYDKKLKEVETEISFALGELAKARSELAKVKCEKVIEHLEESLENGPVICFAHHKEVIKKIAESFGEKAVTLTGETKLEDRQKAVDRFQNGEVDLFVGNIQAAGVGITLVRSSHVVFAELDWVPGNMSQCEDRAARIGQKQSVLVQHVVLEGSLDAYISKKLIEKQEVIDQALDRKTEAPELETPILMINYVPKIVEEKEKPEPKEFIKRNFRSIVSFEELAEDESVSEEERALIHTQLKKLAGVCDGASKKDDVGFNAVDTHVGRKLARLEKLSSRQAVLGRNILAKYKNQLKKI